MMLRGLGLGANFLFPSERGWVFDTRRNAEDGVYKFGNNRSKMRKSLTWRFGEEALIPRLTGFDH